MTILIGALEFEGPFEDFDSLSDEPGLFAVLTCQNEEYELVELEDADYVRTTLHEHEQRAFWVDNTAGSISVAVHYTPDLTMHERREIKDTLLAEFDLPMTA
jgi:hypothetical protein